MPVSAEVMVIASIEEQNCLCTKSLCRKLVNFCGQISLCVVLEMGYTFQFHSYGFRANRRLSSEPSVGHGLPHTSCRGRNLEFDVIISPVHAHLVMLNMEFITPLTAKLAGKIKYLELFTRGVNGSLKIPDLGKCPNPIRT